MPRRVMGVDWMWGAAPGKTAGDLGAYGLGVGVDVDEACGGGGLLEQEPGLGRRADLGQGGGELRRGAAGAG